MYISNPSKGKGKKILGLILIIIAGITYPNNKITAEILITIGVILFVVGKFQHWWHWK